VSFPSNPPRMSVPTSADVPGSRGPHACPHSCTLFSLLGPPVLTRLVHSSCPRAAAHLVPVTSAQTFVLTSYLWIVHVSYKFKKSFRRPIFAETDQRCEFRRVKTFAVEERRVGRECGDGGGGSCIDGATSACMKLTARQRCGSNPGHGQ